VITIEVAYALPDEQFVERREMPDGACVADALSCVARAPGFSDLELSTVAVGIFGRPVPRDRLLHDGDRVEIYRELLIDPKEARRLRATNKLT
jgi:uncharacterized protein